MSESYRSVRIDRIQFLVVFLMSVFHLQVGDVGERPLGSWVANAAGEEASLDAASCQLQALPDNGDQPQGEPLVKPV